MSLIHEGHVCSLSPNDLERFSVQVKSRLTGYLLDFGLSYVLGVGLILEGRTRSYYAKQLAQEKVKRLTTIPILRNDIKVC